jgi:hypothetical protein
VSDGAAVQVAPDGTVIYRASALGYCSRRLIAARLEYEPLPPPKDVAARFARGHAVENVVMDLMGSEGWKWFDAQDEVQLRVSKNIVVVGHIDGRCEGRVRALAVTDVKSQSKSAWDAFERDGWESGFFPHYKWQFSVYMHATKLPGRLVRAMVDNVGDVVKLEVTEVPFPFYSVEQIRTRVLLLESLAMTGAVPKECDQRDYPCPYFYIPGHDRIADDGTRVTLDDPAVTALALEYESMRLAEKVAKERKEVARVALREVVGADRRVSTKDGIKVTFYDQGRTYVDTEEMKKDGVYEKYERKSSSERIRVTVPKAKEDMV